jgi:hypothetical protein
MATSNKMAYDWVTSVRPEVRWVKKARWVDCIDATKKVGVITSSGVPFCDSF